MGWGFNLILNEFDKEFYYLFLDFFFLQKVFLGATNG